MHDSCEIVQQDQQPIRSSTRSTLALTLPRPQTLRGTARAASSLEQRSANRVIHRRSALESSFNGSRTIERLIARARRSVERDDSGRDRSHWASISPPHANGPRDEESVRVGRESNFFASAMNDIRDGSLLKCTVLIGCPREDWPRISHAASHPCVSLSSTTGGDWASHDGLVSMQFEAPGHRV